MQEDADWRKLRRHYEEWLCATARISSCCSSLDERLIETFANLQQNFDSVLPIMGCIDWPPSQDSQGSRRARCKMTRFDRRVRQLEARASTNYKTSGGRCEVWIELKDGRMCGHHGRAISRSEFEQRHSGASAVVILPHNERDDPLPFQIGQRKPSVIC